MHALILAGLLALAPAATRPLPEPVDVAVDVAIDAQGRVTEAELVTDVAAGTGQRLLERVRTFEFTPAQREGQPVPARTTVYLSLAFESLDESRVAVRIRDAYTGPRWKRLEPPRYPTSLARQRRGGDVAVLARYDADGRVVATSIRSSGGPELDAAAAAAVGRSRLQAEIVDGQPIAGEIVVPISFRIVDARGRAAVKPQRTPREFSDSVRDTPEPERQVQADSVVALLGDVRGTLL